MKFTLTVTLIFILLVLKNGECRPQKRSIVNLIEFIKQAEQICRDMADDDGILNEQLEKKYFDKNGDDKIESSDINLWLNEHDQQMADFMPRILTMHDLNNDGTVSMEEYLEKISEADDDNDGKISLKECVNYELNVYKDAGGD